MDRDAASQERERARAEHERHVRALREHLALSGNERLVRSLAMMFAAPEANRSLDDDDPSEFYARARRLGMIKG